MASGGKPGAKAAHRVGLWMIGACGGVGSTVALGLAALRRRLASATGLVSELAEFRRLGLVPVENILVGGHEVRSETLYQAVKASHRDSRLFSTDLIEACRSDLRADQRRIRGGTLCAASDTVRTMASRPSALRDRDVAEAVKRLSGDIRDFRRRNRLARVIVVHVASAEPTLRRLAAHRSYSRLLGALGDRGTSVLAPSSIYALAALEADCPYINFTPSAGIGLPALVERAEALGLPYMGDDGKTGESLVKSFLAPMFALRHLNVLSWYGQNILGNRDGLVLNDPKSKQAKIRSKEGLLSGLGGGTATRTVSIDFVPSLGDWKVAWDFIHFEGFLNTKMSMQFTWQGSDSVLAAPLVIDLVRFADHAAERGLVGPLTHLACFFKAPIGVTEHAFSKQWERLVAYAESSHAR